MALIAGIDGFRENWVAVLCDTATGRLEASIVSTEGLPSLGCDVLAIDIPIGLPEAGARAADGRARAFVRHRASSVFPAPVRAAAGCRTHGEANAVTRSINGKGVSLQAFALYPKIHAVRRLLLQSPTLADRVYEIHPEVSFTAWGGQPMAYPKKRADGRYERQQLIASEFGSAFSTIRQACDIRVPDDDLADAFAGLWSARRILDQAASRFPEEDVRDATLLSMNIWY